MWLDFVDILPRLVVSYECVWLYPVVVVLIAVFCVTAGNAAGGAAVLVVVVFLVFHFLTSRWVSSLR